MERYADGTAGREFDPTEADERPWSHRNARILHRSHVCLGDLLARPRAGIAHREYHIEAVHESTHGEPGVFEVGVRKPVPERE